MRKTIIRSVATTGVLAGLLFTGPGVAAAEPDDGANVTGGTGAPPAATTSDFSWTTVPEVTGPRLLD
ncbi:MAG: hypothetical protein M3186_08745 [Actinomycetota bacterium]|nr:hypothetical protein [Actinomycetota bacterium]